METLAYLASAFIGLSLGLIGGGGSIMTVPVLVYFFGVSPILATSYSLFIVGSTSLIGAVNNYRKGLVNIETALLFGLSSITTVFLTRKFLIPVIPRHIATINGYSISQNMMTMVLFALLMLAAATAMIRSGRNLPVPLQATGSTIEITGKNIPDQEKARVPDLPRLLVYGVAIGLATGILGAGGGFLLIPTLVLFVGLPMKEAIGTSLFIIALNSLIGFTGDLGHFTINWIFLIKITSIASVGIFAGGILNRKLDGDRLKTGFGFFVLLMGFYIIVREVIFKK